MNQAPEFPPATTAPSEPRRTGAEPQQRTFAFVDVNADSQSIIVNAPVVEVYSHCFRFEEFPVFLTSIKKINRINETGFTCTSNIFGKEVTSFVAIIMRIPERRIAWQSVSDHFRVGVVLFETHTDDSTEVTVKVRSTVEPLRLKRALRRYLQNFKCFVEDKHSA